MQQAYDVADMERMDRAWSDVFAKRRGWEGHPLEDPKDDLRLFFDSLAGRRVIDAGCGWGRYIRRFTARGLDYVGIDQSAEMLKAARQRNPDTRFISGTIRQMPFPDKAFDGIWSCCALSSVPKAHITAVLAEHRRVLCPSGSMMIVMPYIGCSDEGVVETDDDLPIFLAAYELDEFCNHVESAGFRIVQDGYRFERGSMFVLAMAQ